MTFNPSTVFTRAGSSRRICGVDCTSADESNWKGCIGVMTTSSAISRPIVVLRTWLRAEIEPIRRFEHLGIDTIRGIV
jgi:hypothetical protein